MKNERIIDGKIQFRRFAYRHKKDPNRFGVLKAVDYRNARNHLGSGFYIRQIWLTREEVCDQAFDNAIQWKIVSSIIPSKT